MQLFAHVQKQVQQPIQKQVQQRIQKMIPVSTLMAVLLSSCAHGPLPECYPLITVLNKGSEVLTNVDLNDGAAVEQKANALKTISQELETLELTNKRLQEFRNDFVKIYQTYSHAFSQTREAIALVNTPSPTEVTVKQVQQAKLQVDRASLSVNQASPKAEVLSQQINQYCRVSSR